MRGRKKIEGPVPQPGDVFALYHKGAPHGRRVKVFADTGDKAKVQSIDSKGAPEFGTRPTYISISTMRPTANGWHLVERGGCKVVWDAASGKVVAG